MEHTTRAVVVDADMGWSDIGSWSALWHASGRDEAGNVITGNVESTDTSNSYLRSDGPLLATVGLDGFAVVASGDAVVVAPMDDVQRVGMVVKGLVDAGRPEALRPTSRETSWGRQEILLEEPNMSVSRLNLRPGSRLNAPRNHDASIYWIVISGRVSVTMGGQTHELVAGCALNMPIGTDYVIEVLADQLVELIEIKLLSGNRDV
jgi:mannose-1-phosphate guanylyltransferase